jgi:hypothetical protein
MQLVNESLPYVLPLSSLKCPTLVKFTTTVFAIAL